MDTPAEIPPGMLDESGVICTDVACRRCGYNLRGLQPLGRCPECATPVGLSVQGDLLRFADPDWLEKLARGISFILWGLAVSVLCQAGAVVLASLVHPGVGKIIAFAGTLLAFYGAWLLTEPDPGGLGEEQYVTARKVVRVGLLVGLVCALASIPLGSGRLSAPATIALGSAAALGGLAGVAGEFAKLVYLGQLAQRIPDQRLARRARFLRWAYGISYAAMVVGAASVGVAAGTAGPTGPGTSLVAAGCFMLVVTLALLAFLLMFLRLQYRFGKAFREQARLARETWAKASVAQVA